MYILSPTISSHTALNSSSPIMNLKRFSKRSFEVKLSPPLFLKLTFQFSYQYTRMTQREGENRINQCFCSSPVGNCRHHHAQRSTFDNFSVFPFFFFFFFFFFLGCVKCVYNRALFGLHYFLFFSNIPITSLYVQRFTTACKSCVRSFFARRAAPDATPPFLPISLNSLCVRVLLGIKLSLFMCFTFLLGCRKCRNTSFLWCPICPVSLNFCTPPPCFIQIYSNN